MRPQLDLFAAPPPVSAAFRQPEPPIPVEPIAGPDLEELRPWLHRVLPLVTRRVRHHGNHRYAWSLWRRDRTLFLPNPAAYPKQPDPLPRSALPLDASPAPSDRPRRRDPNDLTPPGTGAIALQ